MIRLPAAGSRHGYALAGCSYATTGWAIQQALPDQVGTLGVFDRTYRTPGRTIAWGHSLGGIITAGLIQQYPSLFSAALPMCGVLLGGVATWNTALDSAFGFQQPVDPSVQVVNITNPGGNLSGADAAVAAAQQTPQGRARLALAAALGDTPGWFTPLSPEPDPGDYAAQEANQYLWTPRWTSRSCSPSAPSSKRGRAAILVEHRRELRRPAGPVGGRPGVAALTTPPG